MCVFFCIHVERFSNHIKLHKEGRGLQFSSDLMSTTYLFNRKSGKRKLQEGENQKKNNRNIIQYYIIFYLTFTVGNFTLLSSGHIKTNS